MTTIKAYFENNRHLGTLVSAFLVVVTIFFLVKTVNEVKENKTIGGMPTTNVISVTGEGKVTAVPNLAQVSFGVESEAMSVATAQADVTKRIADLTAYLAAEGVESKDVKTTGYNIYPRYEYVRSMPSCGAGQACPAYYPEGQQVLKGYVVSHMIDVKIRKTEDAGKILAGLGERKVTNLSGLNFTVEDENASKEAAREDAINDAKEKAEKLAKALGVKLVKIVSYNENGDYPYYYAKGAYAESAMNMGMGGDADVGIQPGENTITSNVTITYEIR